MTKRITPGQWLRQWRLSRGLTQADVDEATGGINTLCAKLEAGRCSPTAAVRIARAFALSDREFREIITRLVPASEPVRKPRRKAK